MAYSTTDDLMTGTYTWGESIMYPTATSNTNHEAVFVLKAKLILYITMVPCPVETDTAAVPASGN